MRLFLTLIPLLFMDVLWAVEKVESVKFPLMAYLKSLSIIILILVLMLMFVKYLMKGKGLGGGIYGSDLINVIDRLPIEPQVSLYIIRVKEKFMLISVGNKNVTMLQDVTGMVSEDDIKSYPQYSFKEILDKVKHNNEKNR